MDYQVHKVEFAEEFKICPVCGYKDGFHTMLRRLDGPSIAMLFICPSCHEVFDTGQQLKL